jgi:DNA-binding NarL/FixJ family response regulator
LRRNLREPQATSVKFLLADDHALFREGLRLMLTSTYGDSAVVEACTGVEAIHELEANPGLDLAIVDLHMPELDGFALLAWMQQSGLSIPVVVVAGSAEPAEIARAIDAGALGYIPKKLSPADLLAGISQVLNGNLFVPAALAREVAAWRRTQPTDSGAIGLSPRQLGVLKLMREGLGNREIANRLHLGEATVKTHVAALLRATGASNRTACIVTALQKGWIR